MATYNKNGIIYTMTEVPEHLLARSSEARAAKSQTPTSVAAPMDLESMGRVGVIIEAELEKGNQIPLKILGKEVAIITSTL